MFRNKKKVLALQPAYGHDALLHRDIGARACACGHIGAALLVRHVSLVFTWVIIILEDKILIVNTFFEKTVI